MFKLLISGSAHSVLSDDWRVPWRQVVTLSDAAALLCRADARLAQIEQEHEVQMATAHSIGFEKGLSEGRAAAKVEGSASMIAVLTALAAFQAEQRSALGRMALEVVRRFLSDMEQSVALEEFILRRLEELREEHPLAIRVPIGSGYSLSRRLDMIGLAMQVIEDETLAPDACVFKLAGGSAHAAIGLYLSALDRLLGQDESGTAR